MQMPNPFKRENDITPRFTLKITLMAVDEQGKFAWDTCSESTFYAGDFETMWNLQMETSDWLNSKMAPMAAEGKLSNRFPPDNGEDEERNAK